MTTTKRIFRRTRPLTRKRIAIALKIAYTLVQHNSVAHIDNYEPVLFTEKRSAAVAVASNAMRSAAMDMRYPLHAQYHLLHAWHYLRNFWRQQFRCMTQLQFTA